MKVDAKLVITNDDGIDAPGIQALYQHLLPYQPWMVAPASNQSGCGSGLTVTRPIVIRNQQIRMWSVTGTPADCVQVALSNVSKHLPAMVVSGINNGSNVADDIWYSGTIGGAREGRYLTKTPVAVSLAYLLHEHQRYFDTAAVIAHQLVALILASDLPNQFVWNVNVPNIPIGEIQGVVRTHIGKRQVPTRVLHQVDHQYVSSLPCEAAILDEQKGTDIAAIKAKQVSISLLPYQFSSPMALDLLAAVDAIIMDLHQALLAFEPNYARQ